MATATHATFGYTGSLGKLISARSRREPKYSKAKQTRMICAILSRRMMSPPSYEEVFDYVDSQVTYAENKREVLAVFGERSRIARVTDKQMREMYCNSLHNQCASNGLDTCAEACKECKNPAACEKACKIETEIKKHGRELTHIERMQKEHSKEAKRTPKGAKYSTGQIVKCREGYELQCGFSGARKITRVNAYPDYVMYGIEGKTHGFVEEDWIVGVKVKVKKAPKTLPERRGMTTEDEIKQAIQSGAFKRETVKYHKEVERELERRIKPPKKVKKIKLPKVAKPPKKPKPSKALHAKTLTDAQIKHARKYGYVNVTIEGVKKRVTKRNYAPRKRAIQWYKSGGKVCLKTVRG